MKIILKENKGIISSEIILVLIMLILILGILSNITENSSEKISNSIDYENQRLLSNEICDYLTNNPGHPNNWEKLDNLNEIIPGLAILNSDNKTIQSSISYDKLLKLKDNYNSLINKLFKTQLKTSITIKPINSSVSPIFLGSNEFNENIIAINKIVTCDFFSKYVINNFNKKEKCNQMHGENFTCGHFKIFKSYLKNINYYLLINSESLNNDLYLTIDNTKEIDNNYTLINNEKISLNPILEEKLKTDNEGIFFIHFNKENDAFKALLIGVPKDFENDKLFYDYFINTNCNFTLKTWY